jgi:hypothetical protein
MGQGRRDGNSGSKFAVKREKWITRLDLDESEENTASGDFLVRSPKLLKYG